MNEPERAFATVMAVSLCIVGILLILFELAMVGSEPGLFLTGGWRVFLVIVLIAVGMLAVGVLIILTTTRRR